MLAPWSRRITLTTPVTSTDKLPKAFIRHLEHLIPPSARYFDPNDCWVYGYDNSLRQRMPEAVVFPNSHQQVSDLVKLCNDYTIALTPRGRGTGTTGAAVPIRGGVVVSLERMTKIREFSPENRYIVVEPGLTNQALQEAASAAGMFWPPDPTSAAYCSIGGNLAFNSAGPRAVKYGTPRENTLGLRAVTGAGKEIRVGVQTTKGVVGYDLTRLIIGSEGTLAIITEATLKLLPIAEAKCTLRAIYQSVAAAMHAVCSIMTQRENPCALEFIDGQAIKMIRGYSDAEVPDNAGALLMIEWDGPAAALDAAVEKLIEAAEVDGLIDISSAKSLDEADALWKIRKALSPALRKVAPKKINEDVGVPITQVPALIEGLEALSEKHQIGIVNFGHAGNGNIHVNLLLDPDKPGDSDRAKQCLNEVFSLVLKLNGTLSGEHGIGLEKQQFLAWELDSNVMQLTQDIKRQFDPRNVLNPGKMALIG